MAAVKHTRSGETRRALQWAVADDPLDYARLVREALRDVPRQALRLVASEGLPGEHHFYLTFRTSHAGVAVSRALHARHPEEMTIVLQHQFWDLAVGEEAFSVTLRFDGAPERLHVPFAALVAFADPAAGFGLRFDAGEEPAEPAPAAVAAEEGPAGNVVDIRSFRRPGREEREG
jgi:hypothetical protein